MPEGEESTVEPADAKASLEAVFESGGATEGPVAVGDLSDGPVSDNWLTTGTRDLDRNLGGGMPPGRLIAFKVPTDAQSELFIQHLASEHDSLYLSSLRPKWEVEETVRDHVQGAKKMGADGVNTRVEYLDPEDRIQEAREHLELVGERSIVVVDSADELEAEDSAEYVEFLNRLKRVLWDTGSAGLLHCFERDREPAGRRTTLRMADIIWDLRRSVRPGDIEYLLVVSKFRGGRALTEPIKLELTNEVRIDTSRDIA